MFCFDVVHHKNILVRFGLLLAGHICNQFRTKSRILTKHAAKTHTHHHTSSKLAMCSLYLYIHIDARNKSWMGQEYNE